MITDLTNGGYQMCRDFTYFAGGQPVAGATPNGTALPAIAATRLAGDFTTVADAHSAIGSYLPCF